MTTATTATDDKTQDLPVEFRGTGLEFFKIWAANMFLITCTLGIYSAWAKVRTKRYFYSNLYIGEYSFQYVAKPMAILIGRAIALGFIGAYMIAIQLFPFLGIVFMLILMLATPYLIARSIAFNHQMSIYRNIHFRFHSAYGEAVMALLVWPLLGIVTCGILYPVALLRANQFIVNHSAYGTTLFSFAATFKQYAVLTYPFMLAVFVAILAPLVLVDWPGLSSLGSGVLLAVAFAWYKASITNLYYTATTLGNDTRFTADLGTLGLMKLYFVNVVLITLTLGLYMPVAQVRMAQYKAAHIRVIVNGTIDKIVAEEEEQVNALGEELGEVFDFGASAV